MHHMPKKNVYFFSKNCSQSRDHSYCKTLKIHKKNYVKNYSKTWHTYVSRGALSIVAIKCWSY